LLRRILRRACAGFCAALTGFVGSVDNGLEVGVSRDEVVSLSDSW
jgi:hypothetical protein